MLQGNPFSGGCPQLRSELFIDWRAPSQGKLLWQQAAAQGGREATMVCRHFAWRLWLFSKPTRLAKKGNVKLSTALVAQMVDLPADSSEAGCQFDEGWKSHHFTVSHRFQRRMDRTFEFIMTDTFQDSLKHLWKHFHNYILFLLFLKEKLQTQVDRYMRIFKTNRILRKTIAAKNFLVLLSEWLLFLSQIFVAAVGTGRNLFRGFQCLFLSWWLCRQQFATDC